jgi:transposase-like protein
MNCPGCKKKMEFYSYSRDGGPYGDDTISIYGYVCHKCKRVFESRANEGGGYDGGNHASEHDGLHETAYGNQSWRK